MTASFVSRPKRLGTRLTSALAVLVFLGALSTTSAPADSIVLTGAGSERDAALGADELARLSLPALGANPAAAAAIHSAADIVIFPSTAPVRDHRATRSLKTVSTEPINKDEAAALAVPEPTTLLLGLTSTLVLGSLSWKRRLTHHHHPSRI